MQTKEPARRRRSRSPILACCLLGMAGTLFLTADPASADTGSGTLLYVGVGANGCRAGGSVDFKDDGDRFTVHDFCPDGYRVVFEICEVRQDRPCAFAGSITNTNGFDGAAESRSINIRDGVNYSASLTLANGSNEITSTSKVITE